AKTIHPRRLRSDNELGFNPAKTKPVWGVEANLSFRACVAQNLYAPSPRRKEFTNRAHRSRGAARRFVRELNKIGKHCGHRDSSARAGFDSVYTMEPRTMGGMSILQNAKRSAANTYLSRRREMRRSSPGTVRPQDNVVGVGLGRK